MNPGSDGLQLKRIAMIIKNCAYSGPSFRIGR